jgi:hypothetical protein
MAVGRLTENQTSLLRAELQRALEQKPASREALVSELASKTGLNSEQVSEFIYNFGADEFQSGGAPNLKARWLVALGLTLASPAKSSAASSPATLPQTHQTEWLGNQESPVQDDTYVLGSLLAKGQPTSPTLTLGVQVKSVFVMPPNLEFALLQFATNADGHLKEKELLKQLFQARHGGHLGDRVQIKLAHQSRSGVVSEEQSLSGLHEAHGFEWDFSTTIRLPQADGRLLARVEWTEAQSPTARLEQSLRLLDIENDKIQGISQAINQSASQLQNQGNQRAVENSKSLFKDATRILSTFLVPAQVTNELVQQLAEALKSARLRKQIEAAGDYVAPQASGFAAFYQTIEKNKPTPFVVRLDSDETVQFRCNLADALERKSPRLATAYRELSERGETLELSLEVLKREAPEFPKRIPHADFARFLEATESDLEGSLHELAHIDGFWTPVGRKATSPTDMTALASDEALSHISALRVGKASGHQDYVRNGDVWEALEE